MRIRLLPLVIGALALTWTACPRPVPTPPPPSAPEVQIPPGCERNLSGTYAYVERPDWQYVGADDGGTLVLELQRADAGPSDVEIVLSRTPKGFVGGIEHTAFPAPGVKCPVVFDTEVTSCSDGGLTLSSVESLAVDETCHPAPADGGVRRREHQLVPVSEAPAPDSGSL